MSEFVQMNLNDIIDQLGEDRTKTILSSFSCPLNKDVEKFLRDKAIEFSKRDFSKTHLVYWVEGDQKELIGYFTISLKTIDVAPTAVSHSCCKKLAQYSQFDKIKKCYTLSAYLIGQLGKNYYEGNDCLISGDELLQMAIDKIKSAQREVGGKYTYLECEDKPKLIKFYEDNGFQTFGNRRLDRDETDIDGQYLIQLLKYIK